jgi:uncharacterized protein involved in outer membrane biogenesis
VPTAITLHLPRALRITLIALLALVLLILLLAAFFPWNSMRGALEHLLSADLHREVHIARLSGRLFQRTPRLTIEGLEIGNPTWAAAQNVRDPMLQLSSATLEIEPWHLLTGHLVLARLQIERPQLMLLRDENNRANWDFAADQNRKKPPQKPGPPMQLPLVHLFTLEGGSLNVNDQVRKLTFDGSVNAHEGGRSSRAKGFELRGHGALNGKPFELTFGGSPLFNLRLDRPYDYDAQLRAGALSLDAKGSIDKPFDMSHLGAIVKLKGDNLASLYYLTGLALPFTPPFQLSAQLRRDGMVFRALQLQGRVGNSDLEGDIHADVSGKRPELKATLHSHALDLVDLAPTVGAGVSNDNSNAKADTEPPKSEPSAGLLPTHEFQFDRLQSMDASVEFHADSVKTEKLPIKAVELKLALKDGVLTLDPTEMTLPEGDFNGAIRLNAHHSPPDTTLDVRLNHVELSQLKSAKMSDAPLKGDLISRLQLEGHGNSAHDVFASANGRIVAVIPGGEMRQAFAELLGINMARALGLLIADKDKEVPIRCAIAAFNVQNGHATAEPLVFDTDTVDVTGRGGFDFNSEAIDLRLKGNSKKFAPLHVRAPVTIHGTLSHPSIGLDPKSLAAQGGVAAALGVVATPAAAMLAFLDPGLAKDKNCDALLTSPAEKAAEQPGPPQLPPPN